MSELQPGMLALVIGAKYCKENIGKVFEISAVDKIDQTALIISDDAMGIDLNTMNIGFFGHMWANLSDLLPIRPEADPLDVTHKEELHA